MGGLIQLLKTFVRKAPQYQQMPNGKALHSLWRWVSGFIFFLKQTILYLPITARRLKALKSLKGSKTNKQVLIIANGPSSKDLNESEIRRLKELGCDFIVMNGFGRMDIAEFCEANYYFLLDPDYDEENNPDRESINDYLRKNRKTFVVLSSTAPMKNLYDGNKLFLNGIQAVGLWNSESPILPNTHPQSVLFAALKFAHYLDYSTIMVCGVDNSYYLHHVHNQFNEILIKNSGIHAYEESAEEMYRKTIPYLTRNMSDVLYSHAIFLRELRKFANGKRIVNVGVNDVSNDALPFGRLLT